MANRGGKHGDIVGGVGVPPPPGAPVELAQPLSAIAVADAAARAQANEKPLPPFNPRPAAGSDTTVAAARAKDVEIARGRAPKARPPVVQGPQAQTTPSNATIILTDADSLPAAQRMQPGDTHQIIKSMGKQILVAQDMQDAREAVEAAGNAAAAEGDAAQAALLQPTPPAIASAPAPDLGAAELPIIPPGQAPPAVQGKLGQAARDLLASRVRSAQPAASATDSPARGIPHETADAGKRITGGFGDAIDQQYFPLDGSELRELVRGILRYLDDQMNNDLRFSIALCYPRVRAQVTIAIQGYTSEMDFALTRGAEHAKTSVEIAELTGATPVNFTVDGTIEEMTAEGESVMPPNAMREAVGLAVPRKERIQMPTGGFSVVDRRA